MGKLKGLDMYERLNFLFQSAYLILKTCPGNIGLLCYYGYMIKMISQKTQSKLGPHAKRQICKRCNVILHPGITSEVRLRSKRSKHIVITCKVCGEIKRFLSKPDFQLWHDKPAAMKKMKRKHFKTK